MFDGGAAVTVVATVAGGVRGVAVATGSDGAATGALMGCGDTGGAVGASSLGDCFGAWVCAGAASAATEGSVGALVAVSGWLTA